MSGKLNDIIIGRKILLNMQLVIPYRKPFTFSSWKKPPEQERLLHQMHAQQFWDQYPNIRLNRSDHPDFGRITSLENIYRH